MLERVSRGLFRNTTNNHLLERIPGTAQAYRDVSTGQHISQRQFRTLQGKAVPRKSKAPTLYKQWITGRQDFLNKQGTKSTRQAIRQSEEFKRIWKDRNHPNKLRRLSAAFQANRMKREWREYWDTGETVPPEPR